MAGTKKIQLMNYLEQFLLRGNPSHLVDNSVTTVRQDMTTKHNS